MDRGLFEWYSRECKKKHTYNMLSSRANIYNRMESDG